MLFCIDFRLWGTLYLLCVLFWNDQSHVHHHRYCIHVFFIADLLIVVTELCTSSSVIAESARVTISDSGRSANLNCNPAYDFCNFYLANKVVHTWNYLLMSYQLLNKINCFKRLLISITSNQQWCLANILFITSCNSRPPNGTTPFSRAVPAYGIRPFLLLSARATALLPWPRPQSSRLYGICSASVPLAHVYGALSLTMTCVKLSLGQDECMCQSWPDQPSCLADYNEHTNTQTDRRTDK